MKKIKQVANDNYERELWDKGFKYICGVDEAGLGSLAGSLTVGVCVLPVKIDYKTILPNLNDSKTKTEQERQRLYELIKKHSVAYAYDFATVEEIEELNVYWARFLAARRALKKLQVQPDYVLMDGNKEVPEITIPQQAIVKGDLKSISIAAASIVAKVERDEYVKKLADEVHEDYGWKSNKAYYCAKHVEALKKHGATKWHRAKFIEKIIKER